MQFQNVQQSGLANNQFREVLFTNKHSQVVLMSIPPGEDIGREVHELVDQVLVFVKGEGRADVGGETHDISPGAMFVAVSYTHLRAHETPEHLVCRLLLE